MLAPGACTMHADAHHCLLVMFWWQGENHWPMRGYFELKRDCLAERRLLRDLRQKGGDGGWHCARARLFVYFRWSGHVLVLRIRNVTNNRLVEIIPLAFRRLSWSPTVGGFSMELRIEPRRSAILNWIVLPEIRLLKALGGNAHSAFEWKQLGDVVYDK